MPSRRKLDATTLATLLVSACVLPLVMTGCGPKTVKAAAPVAAAPASEAADSKPLTNIAPDTDALPPAENVPTPPNPVSAAAVPLPVAPAQTKPTPPARKPPTESAGDSPAEQPARTPAPQISPQLSPGDQASLQRKTQDDIGVAQKNLQQSSGRVLSAAQTDLVEKIKSFLSQSTEASKTGDWARAQNLSQKARLLSVELVDSL
jgi:DNA polymerase III gamma/tau subunit